MRRLLLCGWIGLATALAAAMPSHGHAAPQAAGEVQTNLNYVWTILAAALVFFMQAGFALLEALLERDGLLSSSGQFAITLVEFSLSALKSGGALLYGCLGALGFSRPGGDSLRTGAQLRLALFKILLPGVELGLLTLLRVLVRLNGCQTAL